MQINIKNLIGFLAVGITIVAYFDPNSSQRTKMGSFFALITLAIGFTVVGVRYLIQSTTKKYKAKKI